MIDCGEIHKCEFGRDWFKAADLRPATEMCVGSNPTARILFLKYFKYLKSNITLINGFIWKYTYLFKVGRVQREQRVQRVQREQQGH